MKGRQGKSVSCSGWLWSGLLGGRGWGGVVLDLACFGVLAVGFGIEISFLVELVVVLDFAWNAVGIHIRVGQRVSFGGFQLSALE